MKVYVVYYQYVTDEDPEFKYVFETREDAEKFIGKHGFYYIEEIEFVKKNNLKDIR